MAEVITSRANARVKQLRAAFAGQAKLAGGLIAIEGEHLVEAALLSGQALKTVFVSERREMPEKLPKNLEIVRLANDVFQSCVDTQTPQGIAALLVPLQSKLEKMLTANALILVAAGLQDPGNLGTLVRSAEAFGATGVLTTPGTASVWNQKALRASAGSVFRVPQATAEEDTLARLKQGGVKLLAAMKDNAGPADRVDLSGPVAILIGNEGAGLAEGWLAMADERFRDNPMVHGGLYLRFYAGVPVTSANGHNIGTFCIADTRLRAELTDADKVSLATLAEMVSEMVEENRQNHAPDPLEHRQRDREALMACANLDGVWNWDILENRVYYSPRWQHILGLEEVDCVATIEYWTRRIHPEDRAAVSDAIKRQMAGVAEPFRSEHRVEHGDGTWRWVVVRGLTQRDAAGKATRIAGSLMDVTQEKTSDPLTRLPNRLVFHDRLTRLMQLGQGTRNWRFAVFLVDIDRFKAINEQHGREAGDKVLVAFAERASAFVGKTRQGKDAMVARLGGDEFVLVLDGICNARQAEAVAKRLHAAISAPIHLDGESIQATISIGIAMAGPEFKSPESFLHNADLALCEAKEAGRNASAVFDPRMREEHLRQLKTSSMLRRAVGLGEMRLFFQPQVDLATGAIIGCEALVRWQHPELGMVPPDYFIPLAEKTGLIGEIDRWVLKTAARQIAEWRAVSPVAHGWHMSVNVSAEKFPSTDLLRNVRETLAHYDLPASVLCMEITETALMRHVAESAQTMRALRTIGVGLHMDDFGSGYSSFKQLYELPFDTLKIDRSFLQRIIGNPQAINIVKAILSLAETLGMSSIAEGIETPEQEALLRGMGCGRGQGYLYSRPIDAKTFAQKYLVDASAAVERP